jgi:hypothetical protein
MQQMQTKMLLMLLIIHHWQTQQPVATGISGAARGFSSP